MGRRGAWLEAYTLIHESPWAGEREKGAECTRELGHGCGRGGQRGLACEQLRGVANEGKPRWLLAYLPLESQPAGSDLPCSRTVLPVR